MLDGTNCAKQELLIACQMSLRATLRVMPVSVLTGARQICKTTLTQAIKRARVYLS